MNQTLTKKDIRQKTAQTGSLTLASRAFGLIRELLLARYLGSGAISDAFVTAFKIPNLLRKVFAEGALSAAFVPTIIKTVKIEGKQEANSLMTLAFIIFEGAVLAICLVAMIFPRWVIYTLAPGFNLEQITQATSCLLILMPFIFFVSAGALLTGALQAENHFFIPAIAPVILNGAFIMGIVVGLMYGTPITTLCYFILFGGLLQLAAHLVMYYRLAFSFGKVTKESFKTFISVFIKFILCMPSVALSEINLLIDHRFASYIVGGASCINYANRFMGIPLGVFATSFATILLPHFTRVSGYAPKRLSFYLLESTKLVLWVCLPITCGMIFFSYDIFYSLFYSPQFPLEQILRCSHVLIACVLGLFFFSINKILVNIFYAAHKTFIPGCIAIIAALVNIGLNYLLMPYLEVAGLALASTCAAGIQTILSYYFLQRTLSIKLYTGPLALFVYRFTIQLTTIGCAFLAFYWAIKMTLTHLLWQRYAHFFLHQAGLWLWVTPLLVGCLCALLYSRRYFKVKLYFLD